LLLLLLVEHLTETELHHPGKYTCQDGEVQFRADSTPTPGETRK
jgi:hypothetical protein